MKSFADGFPVVSHVKGVVHYAIGNTEKGNNCMKSASRTTAVLAGGAVVALTGGIVLAVAGGVIIARVASNVVTTGIESAAYCQYKLAGTIAAVTQAVGNGKKGKKYSRRYL